MWKIYSAIKTNKVWILYLAKRNTRIIACWKWPHYLVLVMVYLSEMALSTISFKILFTASVALWRSNMYTRLSISPLFTIINMCITIYIPKQIIAFYFLWLLWKISCAKAFYVTFQISFNIWLPCMNGKHFHTANERFISHHNCLRHYPFINLSRVMQYLIRELCAATRNAESSILLMSICTGQS